MKVPSLDNTAHWRRRAEEARRMADQIDDPVAKRTMMDIAAAYEQFVALIEKKRRPKPGGVA